jgi:hypothetical protein
MDILSSITSLIFGIVVIFIIYRIVKDNIINRNKPKIALTATIVTKRQQLSSNMSDSHHTWHYITFEFDTRDRIELQVSGREYGLMAENDKGILTFQGNQFIAFDRKRV